MSKTPEYMKRYEQEDAAQTAAETGQTGQTGQAAAPGRAMPSYMEQYREEDEQERQGEPTANPPQGEFNPPLGEGVWKATKANAGALTSFDENERLKIYQENYPKLEKSQDREGNIILNAKAYTGEDRWQYLNEPGVSGADVFPAVLGGLSMMPAGKAARVGGAALTKIGAGRLTQAIAPGITPNLYGSAARGAGLAATGQAGIEGIQAATGGEFNEAELGIAAAGSAIGDVAFSMVARGLGLNMSISRKVKGHLDALRERYGKKAAKAQELGEEFDIPYTRGEATGDMELLMQEDMMRAGTGTQTQQRIMSEFKEEAQYPKVQQAVGRIQQKHGKPGTETAAQAGEDVGNEVTKKADDLWQDIAEAYEKVNESGSVRLSGKDSAQFMDTIQGIAKRNDFEVAREWPSTQRVMEILGESAQWMRGESAPSVSGKATEAINEGVSVSLAKLNKIRKQIIRNKNGASNSEDKRQVIELLKIYDRKMEKMEIRGLFSGDPKAIQALRDANTLRRTYGELFSPKTMISRGSNRLQDGAGKFIENMVEMNPTGKEVIDGIFSANSLYKKGGDKVLSRIKKIVEPDTYDNIKRAGIMRLFGEITPEIVPSAAKFHTNLTRSLRDAMPVMLELYGKEGINELKRLGKAIRLSQPTLPRGSLNTSGSGYVVLQGLKRSALKESGLVGLGLDTLIKSMTGGKAASAIKALRPFEGYYRAVPRAVGATTARAVNQETNPAN